jgi:4-hydroxy-3-polyprenylbenzoate decarboxylase
VVVVDDDIDITDDNDLVWALCTRVDPRTDLTVIEGAWSSPLDPMAYPRSDPRFNARVVIDACRPWDRIATFPKVVGPSPGLKQRLIETWSDVLPNLREL